MIGHDAIWQYLTAAGEGENLAHAFLFTGPKHVGKAHLAESIAAYWLCQTGGKNACTTCSSCTSLQRGTHPDLFRLTLAEDEHQIPIKSMRAFLSSLSQSPALGAKKIGIIDGSDQLSTGAANAFLKTLEEPPKSTTLILIAHDPQRILPTIKSRCQIIEFGRVFDADPAILRDEAWQRARGLPGLYKRGQQGQEDYDQFIHICSLTPGQRLAAIESEFASKRAHAPAKSIWQSRLSAWQRATRDMMCDHLGLKEAIETRPEPFPRLANVSAYQRAIDEISRIQNDIHANINIRAHIEAFLISLPRSS